ncbi:unnamed protein product [Caenorhabditis angaria]|uniref:Myb-like domain-containing protein n=1 Tax=Caenorhabditis angaria TaxID=860376 RepID=A0A9P1N060_9PELO|nr:unnamed protein product [Caenorhabditis angaria]
MWCGLCFGVILILAIGFNDEYMPSWLPPSPPMSDNEFDLKMEDDTFDLIYEIDPMNEARLPSHIEELRRPLREKQKQNEDVMLGSNIINNKDKDLLHDFSKRLGFPSNSSNSANAAASSPGYSENSFSMDDSSQESKPDVFASRMAALSGQQTQQQKQAKKRTNKSHRSSEVDALRSFTPPPAIKEEIDYDGAEWSLVEDYTLLQAVQNEIANLHEFETPRKNEGMVFNWEYVAISVNKVTRFYRSARQCSIRYQMYVRPKESGVMYACDPVTKNRMKIEMGPAEVAHIRKGRAKTESQYQHEGGSIMDKKHLNRFKAVKTLADKKPAIFWRGPKELRKIEALENRLPLKHETKLREFDVKVGTLSDAEQISTIEEDKMVTNEPKKKVGIIDRSRANSPPPRRNILLLRPHAMPVSKNKELLPVRSNMTIEVPQLRDPQLHIAQQQQQLQQQQNQQPTRIPHVIPSMDHSSQSQIIQSQQHPQHPQRRIAQTHYIQQTQGNYVMVNSQNSEQTVQSVVQQQHLQQQQQQSQNVQQQQQQPQMQPQQRMTQYVTPQQIQSQRGLPMYTSSPQVVVTRGAPRVMRGGGTSRMYLQQTTAGGQSYVMTNHTQPVRVMPATQRVIHTQGTMGGQRRTQPPQPGTVASMIMPGRGGGVAQMRTIQRSYPAQRINLVVQNQQQQMRQAPGTTTHLITTTGPGGPTVKRQLVTGRPLPTLGRPVEQQQQSSSSQGLPPTSSSSSQSQPVAQVVLAPPTSSTNSHVQSQPPQRPPPPPQQQPQQQSNDTPSIPPPPPQS